jgi:predicted nucleic acid-binding protein
VKTAPREVCVDASLLVKLVLNEPDSDLADALFSRWKDEGVFLIAPVFCPVEVDSVIRSRTATGAVAERLSLEQADLAFEAIQRVPVRTKTETGQRRRAWELAGDLGLPVVYDSHYLALAEIRGCAFWTADRRLYRKVSHRLSYVHLLQNGV